MITPLGTEEKVWKSNLKERLKNKYYKLGNRAALKGRKESENPYTLDEEILKLIKKRTWWILGYKDEDYSDKLRKRRKKQSEKEIKAFEKAHKKKIRVVKDKKEKHEHKHKHKHKSKHK